MLSLTGNSPVTSVPMKLFRIRFPNAPVPEVSVKPRFPDMMFRDAAVAPPITLLAELILTPLLAFPIAEEPSLSVPMKLPQRRHSCFGATHRNAMPGIATDDVSMAAVVPPIVLLDCS